MAARIITVFGSGRLKDGHEHYESARRLGAGLAAAGFAVCTGGYGGVMEAASRGAKEAGGRTLGVTANFFSGHANTSVDEEIRVERWQDRLLTLVERGDGFVVCPGGTGTLVEFAVVWEMLNKGVMSGKPLIALGEFWRPIIERVREVERDRAWPFGDEQNAIVRVVATANEAITALSAYFYHR